MLRLVPYDEELAERVRVAIHGIDRVGIVEERKMFGGLAFLVHDHLTIAVSGQGGIMVRVDPDARAALLEQDQVDPMVMSGRVMRGWLRVSSAGLTDDHVLCRWVERGVAAVEAL